jgi:pyrroloquinoline quinone (PQQ) biosynthesis protein C
MLKHEDLLKLYDQVQGKMAKAVDEFPWEDKSAYLMWLRQSFEYANNSTRILALTAGHLKNNLFSTRFIQHAAEEKGHERLLVNDAKAFKVKIEDLKAYPEAKAFHQSLYYSILYDNPVAIFGWVIMLEGVACLKGADLYRRTVKAHGERAVAFLKVHSDEDIEHIKKALDSVANLEPEDRKVVMESMEMYADLYCNVLNRIKDECKRGNVKVAA